MLTRDEIIYVREHFRRVMQEDRALRKILNDPTASQVLLLTAYKIAEQFKERYSKDPS